MSMTSDELPTFNEKVQVQRRSNNSIRRRKNNIFFRFCRATYSWYEAHRTWTFTILAILATGFSLLLAFVLAQTLLLSDIDFSIQNPEASPRITFASNLIGIDSTMRTLTIDWYPQPPDPTNCGNEFVANIFLDQNLLDDSSPGMVAGSSQPSTPGNPSASTSPSSSVMFQYNSSQACASTEVFQDSDNTFRTISKLIDKPGSTMSSSTLQAYPIDAYLAQLSIYALDNSTGNSIPLDISGTWGTVVNFEASLDRTSEGSFAETDGIYLLFNVTRSSAVQLFVYCVIAANWVVTAAFLWLTIANLLWHSEKIIKEMFVLPVTALFAFTTIRANLPGAPAGFGAYIDFVGILPNLVIITICSAALLLVVLGRRVLREIRLKDVEKMERMEREREDYVEEKAEERAKDEASLLISLLTHRIIKELSLKEYRKNGRMNNENDVWSSDEEAEENKGEIDVLRSKKRGNKVKYADNGNVSVMRKPIPEENEIYEVPLRRDV